MTSKQAYSQPQFFEEGKGRGQGNFGRHRTNFGGSCLCYI